MLIGALNFIHRLNSTVIVLLEIARALGGSSTGSTSVITPTWYISHANSDKYMA